MTTIQTIILGIVEGLTEFLPVSSTGHLAIISHFLNIPQNEQTVVFEIAIQLGAILAVVFIYWKKLFDINLLTKLFVAFLPTGVVGLLLYKFIKQFLDNEFLIAFTLILGGIVLYAVEILYSKRNKNHPPTPSLDKEGESSQELTYAQVFILGLSQCVAMIPGVSRSGAVMTAGLIMNIKRNALVEFTFLLAIPTMFAATLYSVYKNINVFTPEYTYTLGLGFLVSFIVAFIVVKAFLGYIRKFDFIPFAIYRIVFGLFILLTVSNIF